MVRHEPLYNIHAQMDETQNPTSDMNNYPNPTPASETPADFGTTDFQSLYIEELNLLRKQLKSIDNIIIRSPSERLHVKRSNGHRVFYCARETETGAKRDSYLRKNDPLLPILILKYCAERMRPVISRQIKTLMSEPNKYDPSVVESELVILENRFGEMIPDRFLSAASRIKKWTSEPYPSNTRFDEGKKQFKTMKGDLVRSKIEMITADMLYSLSIPYRYEQQVTLLGGRIKYPDFTMMNPYTMKIFYLEVCGLMSKDWYVDDLLEKIVAYSKIGICQGKNLLLAFESDNIAFDTECVREMLTETVLKKKHI
ncbi:MAG: hypothetical protein IJU30_02995 [Lachnospiraceae bacterium]|nr:hypothetical protein [Lachnospiraceae bacterium]